MALIVIESPNKVKKIKELTGARVMATCGHFKDLPRKNFGINLEDGSYTPEFIVQTGKENVISQLTQAARGEDVYIATDPDREGYAIGMFVYQVVKGIAKSTHRLEIHEITAKGVKDAMAKSVPFDKTNTGMFNAFLGRRLADRLVGYILSPLARRALGGELSVGRVQSPAVRLIVDLEREIRAFQSNKYWNLEILLNKAGRQFSATCTRGDISDANEVNAIMAKVSAARTASVLKMEQKETKRSPRAPFTTVDLQAAASAKFGFAADHTMKLAQELFEGGSAAHGLITYHRTDSVRLADEVVVEIRNHLQTFLGPNYVPASPNVFKSKNSQADAHEAIRPTDIHPAGDISKLISHAGLSSDHEKLYTLIYQRTIASQAAPALFDFTAITLDCAGEEFRATGSILKFDGYQAIYSDAEEVKDAKGGDDEPEEQRLPMVAEGETLPKEGEKAVEKKTKPPARYTEGTLVKALERLGIGRPSTYAETLKGIKSRGYVKIEKKKFAAEPLGERLIDYLAQEHPWCIDYQMTKMMEEYLDTVVDGKGDWRIFLKGVHGKMNFAKPSGGGNGPPSDAQLKYAESLSSTYSTPIPVEARATSGACSAWIAATLQQYDPERAKAMAQSKKPAVALGKCPACGNSVVEGAKGFGCAGYRNGCKFTIWKNGLSKVGKEEVTAAQAKKLLDQKEHELDGFVDRQGNPCKHKVKLVNDPEKGWRLNVTFKRPVKKAA